MDESPPKANESKKLWLGGDTYITKVNGKLVMARERPESAFDIGMDLLGEAFGGASRSKMKDGNRPSGNMPNMGAQLNDPPQGMGPPPGPQTSSPKNLQQCTGGIQPGIYQVGDRQLALLPKNSHGQPVFPPGFLSPPAGPPGQQGMFPPPVPPGQSGMFLPQSPYMNGAFGGGYDPGFPHSFPMMAPGYSVPHFAPSFFPNYAAGGAATNVLGKHVCGHCGRLRSKRYQAANPLKKGEVVVSGFCRRCQKDDTSSEGSEASEERKKKVIDKTSKKGKKEKVINISFVATNSLC